MENPFETIMEKLNDLEQQLDLIHKAVNKDSPKKIDGFDDLINIRQVAELLNLSKATIYSKVSRRQLPYYKLSNKLYFSKNEIVELIKNNKGKTLQEIQDEVHTYLIKPKRRRN